MGRAAPLTRPLQDAVQRVWSNTSQEEDPDEGSYGGSTGWTRLAVLAVASGAEQVWQAIPYGYDSLRLPGRDTNGTG